MKVSSTARFCYGSGVLLFFLFGILEIMLRNEKYLILGFGCLNILLFIGLFTDLYDLAGEKMK